MINSGLFCFHKKKRALLYALGVSLSVDFDPKNMSEKFFTLAAKKVFWVSFG